MSVCGTVRVWTTHLFLFGFNLRKPDKMYEWIGVQFVCVPVEKACVCVYEKQTNKEI